MADRTKIEWADRTHNEWVGCSAKASPGCANCYAAARAKRWGEDFTKPRRLSEAGRKKPLSWNRKAEEEQKAYCLWAENEGRCCSGFECGCRGLPMEPPPPRPRIFCGSLMDWLDPAVPIEWLADLLARIAATPHLDWLLLTKRPQLWRERMEAVVAHGHNHGPTPGTQLAFDWLRGETPANVCIGSTIEDQQRADERREHLKAIPARVRFVSYEPALGSVDWHRFFSEIDSNGEPSGPACNPDGSPAIGWLICGGESGPNARPMHPLWAREARDACYESGVAFLLKQWGAWAPGNGGAGDDLWPICDQGRAGFFDYCERFNDSGANPFRQTMVRVGKKAAGRLLDGVIHDEFPA